MSASLRIFMSRPFHMPRSLSNGRDLVYLIRLSVRRVTGIAPFTVIADRIISEPYDRVWLRPP